VVLRAAYYVGEATGGINSFFVSLSAWLCKVFGCFQFFWTWDWQPMIGTSHGVAASRWALPRGDLDQGWDFFLKKSLISLD
jgi:hypothetical protein